MAELQEKQVNLRKDLAEMQEWMAQVDEEFLMRDFEYKGPEELEASLEEMKVRRLQTRERNLPICWCVRTFRNDKNTYMARTTHFCFFTADSSVQLQLLIPNEIILIAHFLVVLSIL